MAKYRILLQTNNSTGFARKTCQINFKIFSLNSYKFSHTIL